MRLALAASRDAISRRFDKLYAEPFRAFFYMPLMHAEDLAVQEASVLLFKANLPGASNLRFAIEHRDIVKRFGRFPHRNRILVAPLDAGRNHLPARGRALIRE
ncbi:MAG: DUF924 family protein [Parvularculaceae bacterium]